MTDNNKTTSMEQELLDITECIKLILRYLQTPADKRSLHGLSHPIYVNKGTGLVMAIRYPNDIIDEFVPFMFTYTPDPPPDSAAFGDWLAFGEDKRKTEKPMSILVDELRKLGHRAFSISHLQTLIVGDEQ